MQPGWHVIGLKLKQENAAGSHQVIDKKENRCRLAYCLTADNWHAKVQADGVMIQGMALKADG